MGTDRPLLQELYNKHYAEIFEAKFWILKVRLPESQDVC